VHYLIRQLIIQATPDDFPTSWHRMATELSMPPIRQRTRNNREFTWWSVA